MPPGSATLTSIKAPDCADFAARLLKWYDHHGRKTLPWQLTKDPYRVWVSEIMLQQTQVITVIAYYQKFIARFPDLDTLAAAPMDAVMHHWSGLGYYARARNLHRAAQLIQQRHAGKFPHTIAEVTALPGIGRSTAGAILALCFAQQHPILDGNVKRILTRMFAIGDENRSHLGDKQVEQVLWNLATRLTPAERVGDFTQAIMDLGATLCVRAKPDCARCPLRCDCAANAAGSQAAYPQPKPKKVKPIRATVMLVVRDPAGNVLLEKRPPAGIWGGLWCLPELHENFVANADAMPPHYHTRQIAAQYMHQHLGLQVVQIAALPHLRHSFTHFDLNIVPLGVKVRIGVKQNRTYGINDIAERIWFNPAEPQQIGLPAVVGKLLDSMTDALKYPTNMIKREDK